MKEKLEAYLKESEATYCERTEHDIEQNRKGSFELILTDAQGKPLENCTVTAEMTALDFNFGCNIFMLGEYDSLEKNKLYEEEFTSLFNLTTLATLVLSCTHLFVVGFLYNYLNLFVVGFFH